jgi:hypothetical protein
MCDELKASIQRAMLVSSLVGMGVANNKLTLVGDAGRARIDGVVLVVVRRQKQLVVIGKDRSDRVAIPRTTKAFIVVGTKNMIAAWRRKYQTLHTFYK